MTRATVQKSEYSTQVCLGFLWFPSILCMSPQSHLVLHNVPSAGMAHFDPEMLGSLQLLSPLKLYD